jgi:hypothetical protein
LFSYLQYHRVEKKETEKLENLTANNALLDEEITELSGNLRQLNHSVEKLKAARDIAVSFFIISVLIFQNSLNILHH